MRNAHLTLFGLLAIIGIACGGAACGVLGDYESTVLGGSGTGTRGSGGFGGGTFASTGTGANSVYGFSDYCGMTCTPGTDSASPCDPNMGTGAGGGTSSAGGMGGSGSGGSGSGGSGSGGSGSGGSGMGGSGSGGSGSGGSGMGGSGMGGSGMGGSGMGGAGPDGDCRLAFDGTSVDGTCLDASGSQPINQPCMKTADCAAGLGCVKIDNNARCRPYCCGDVEACPSATYCALAPLSDGDVPLGTMPTPEIPVCLEADDCELDGTQCTEPEVCTVVRLDAQTSCVLPGTGNVDDECPCAEGLFCDTQQNKCIRWCTLNSPNACPDGFQCQGGSSALPNGFGTCVDVL